MNISLVYSGGAQNVNQEGSLGGYPSPVSVTDTLNNLFDDIPPQQTTQGETDYRCLYIFNDDPALAFTITLYVEYLDDNGASVELGILQQNAVQRLTFPQTVTGGTFTITIQGVKTPTINWDSDPSVLASNIQTAIQTITGCSVVNTVSGQFSYTITFTGAMGNKSISLLLVTDNNLQPYGSLPTITQVLLGSPINTVAPETIPAVIPTGIPFNSALFPGVVIGTLYPSEGFPLWIMRTIAPGFEAVENDGFNLHLRAQSLVLD